MFLEELNHFLATRFGLPVSTESEQTKDGQLLRIRPTDVPRTIGFSVNLLIAWRSISFSFVPATFAADLVKLMEDGGADKKTAFCIFARAIQENGSTLNMQINKIGVDPLLPDEWPTEWNQVDFTLRIGQLVIEPEDPEGMFSIISPWAARFFGATLALLPLKPVEVPEEKGEMEGGAVEVRGKKYERSRINRAACIEKHGHRCKVCDLDFEEKYGQLGREFIHVHHILPVSQMGGSYVVNPSTDLVPVCPNCHAMLHKGKPDPLSIDALKNILYAQGSKTVET